MDKIINALNESYIRLVPLTEGEIRKLESHFKITFPAIYRKFLLTMGKSAGKFMLGSDAFYDNLIDINEWALELIVENNLPPLPEGAFVFWMHQGYQMAFFTEGEGDDPPVYYFSEGLDMKNYRKEKTLTGFFETQLAV